MKKNFFYSLAVMLMAGTMSVSFISCGDDDDKNEQPVVQPSDDNRQYGLDDEHKNDSTKGDSATAIIYRTPMIAWGSTQAAVKSYMADYEAYYEGSDALAYEGKNLESDILYFFTKNVLDESDVYIPFENTTKEALKAQLLAEKYTYSLSLDTVDYYLSADEKTGVLLITDNYFEEYCVAYYDNDEETDETGGEGTPVYPVLFEEPCTAWGASRSNVKTVMENRNYTMIGESDQAEQGYMVAYEGKIAEDYSAYLFDENQNLDYVIMPFSNNSIQEVGNSLIQHASYEYMGESEGDYYFMKDNTVACVYANGSNVTTLQFFEMPEMDEARRDGIVKDNNTLFQQMKSVRKSMKTAVNTRRMAKAAIIKRIMK